MAVKPPVDGGITVFIRGHEVSNSHPITMTIGCAASGAITAPGDVASAASTIAAYMGGAASMFNTNTFWDLAEAKDQGTTGLSATAPIGTQGTLAGLSVDPAQCKLVLVNTGHHRAGIGRLYMPGQVQSDYATTDPTQWVAAVATRALTFMNGLFATLAAHATPPAVISHSLHGVFLITAGSAYSKNLKINHVTRRDS